MIRSLYMLSFAALLLAASPAAAQNAQPTAVQQQAANAAALGQGQVPTAQGAIQTLSQMESGAAPAVAPAAGAPAAATPAVANPGAVPGVIPSKM